jgi:hypothetical protein
MAAGYKTAQVQSEIDFEYRLAPHFDPPRGTAADLRNALWPAVQRKDLNTARVRDRIYDAVISAFDDTLAPARKEERTL